VVGNEWLVMSGHRGRIVTARRRSTEDRVSFFFFRNIQKKDPLKNKPVLSLQNLAKKGVDSPEHTR